MSEENTTPEEKQNIEETEQFEDNVSYQSFSDEISPIDEDQPFVAEDIAPPSSGDAQIIQSLQEQLDATKDQMIRALAEAENARKRAAKDREEASKYAISKFAKSLLPVADNLRRALDAVSPEILEQHPEIKNLTDGIEATERELLRGFEANGIEKLEPLDQPFDPNFHEVMFEAPIPDKASGTIIQIIEPGYTLHGRIMRPARVGVAKETGTAPESDTRSGPGQNINTEA
ncbi:MAG: nucleotide exchange factor GrpE [Alphaproteobacteria bacterium]